MATELQAAVNKLSRSFTIIPIIAGEKRPAVEWKRFQRERPTAQELRDWFSGGAHNLALVCGRASGGLAVLDIDDPDLADRIADDIALALETTMVRSPRGGLHVYVVETDATSRSGPLVAGVADLKAEGGYIMVPPSVVDGREYITLTNNSILSVENAHKWALGLLRAYDVDVEEAPARATAATDPAPDGAIPQGARNDSLISLAGTMRRRGMGHEAITAALLQENAVRCRPPLSEQEVRTIAASGARYEPAEVEVEVHETDLGNAVRLVRRHGGDVRYCFPQSRWYAWDGTRWARDADGEVYRRAKATVRSVFAEAAGAATAERSKQLAHHAIRSEAESRIAAMVSLARSEPGVPVLSEALDVDPWALNVRNGTLDLRTGELRQHRREDLITKLAPVTYDADADCPLWLAFLDRIMDGNTGLTGFLQRAAGYSLTGDVSEQVLFFLSGRGATGKSTLTETVLALLGEYSKKAAPDLLTAKRGERHPTERADLAGARFVAEVETEEGRRLAEALVKELTGGDTIKGRFMREDFWQFTPTHKLWLAANHRPTIKGTDHAIWRRIRLVPFDVVIPDAEQDKQLKYKLRRELPGILNWALEGCLRWQRDGLQPPAEVTAATDQYRAEQDTIGAFIDDSCIIGDDQKVAAKMVYMMYTQWCRDNGEEPMPQRRFGSRLADRGLSGGHKGTGGERWWKGIGLVAQTGLGQIQSGAESENPV